MSQRNAGSDAAAFLGNGDREAGSANTNPSRLDRHADQVEDQSAGFRGHARCQKPDDHVQRGRRKRPS